VTEMPTALPVTSNRCQICRASDRVLTTVRPCVVTARRADDCDNTLMQSRSDSATDKFAPLLHVYDMDVTNGTDDSKSGEPGTTRRDMGPPAELQAQAKAADEAGWSEAKGWASEPGGVSSPSPWGPAPAQ